MGFDNDHFGTIDAVRAPPTLSPSSAGECIIAMHIDSDAAPMGKFGPELTPARLLRLA
jgi:hypothetical protein